MQSHVRHASDNAGNGRGLSAGLFRRFSLEQAAYGVEPGVFVHEDFVTPDAAISVGVYRGFNFSHAGVGLNDAGGIVTVDPGAAQVMAISSDDLFSLDVDDPSVEAAVEFRMKCDSLVAPMAVGFSEDGTAAIDGTGADASVKSVMIVRDSNGTQFKCVVTNGTVATTVGTLSAAVAADEWVRLGVRCGIKGDKQSVEFEFFFNGSRIGRANLSSMNSTTLVDMSDLEAFGSTEGDHLNSIDSATFYTNQ